MLSGALTFNMAEFEQFGDGFEDSQEEIIAMELPNLEETQIVEEEGDQVGIIILSSEWNV
jgi:hypothetical protein